VTGELFSRPARLAALLSKRTEACVLQLFTKKTVLVRLEAPFTAIPDARETFLFTVNQVLRFCSNVGICISREAADLIPLCNSLADQVHGEGETIKVVNDIGSVAADAIVNVGSEVLPGLPSATINSSGWVARLATGNCDSIPLYWRGEYSNPLGALAAACLGSAAAFMAIVGKPITSLMETSLFTYQSGTPGTLKTGPPLPDSPYTIDAFLVGCGAVTNGWAYAVKRLPLTGRLQAIDKQSLRKENLGSYVAAGRDDVGKKKAVLIKELLSPAIVVTERPDQWEFFKIRISDGLRVPPLIVAGLDNVTTRHSVQRMWPQALIDMAAGELQSQVIVKHKGSDGQCLLNALTIPPNEVSWAEALAKETGLSPELIAQDPTGEITQAEVDSAPEDKKERLQRVVGRPRCGHINSQSLELEGYDPDFAPAVPFVTAFSGVVGAAETVRILMGQRHIHSLHFQRSFRSGQARALQMKCDPACECQLPTLPPKET
jgi:ThiF family